MIITTQNLRVKLHHDAVLNEILVLNQLSDSFENSLIVKNRSGLHGDVYYDTIVDLLEKDFIEITGGDNIKIKFTFNGEYFYNQILDGLK